MSLSTGAVEKDIFRRASTTYYWSSMFFPSAIRRDVFRLYSFVRLADDLVDSQPQQRTAFGMFRTAWQAAWDDPQFQTATATADTPSQRAIKNMVYVARTHAFDPAWVTAFLDAMQADLDGKVYHTLQDTLDYTYGSAEVIGLMMAKLMNLSPAAYETAALQGRAMQFINFIRDISEDQHLGRCYFPRQDLERFGLPDLAPDTARTHPAAFRRFVEFQIQRYRIWQDEASQGLRYIPHQPRVAVRTAIAMYDWTARVIAANPLVVYDRKVKPSRWRVCGAAVQAAITP